MDRDIRDTSTSLLTLLGVGAVIASIALIVAATTATGQPAHQPGAICYTQQGWCFAQPPGAPGSACACPTPHGLVPGVRG